MAQLSLFATQPTRLSGPQDIPLVYCLFYVVLVPLRWIYYRSKKWHYYLLDFCYYANIIFLVDLLYYRKNEKLFLICFSFAEGPLARALIVWRCSLVFSSFDKITVESSAREFLGNDKCSSLSASVNFIDLAESERASQTNSAGTRLKEGCHINRSLLTLGTVIRKLSKGRNGHIPFRDSKLTRILQSSLGGNARTAIICTMSPAKGAMLNKPETLSYLQVVLKKLRLMHKSM